MFCRDNQGWYCSDGQFKERTLVLGGKFHFFPTLKREYFDGLLSSFYIFDDVKVVELGMGLWKGGGGGRGKVLEVKIQSNFY